MSRLNAKHVVVAAVTVLAVAAAALWLWDSGGPSSSDEPPRVESPPPAKPPRAAPAKARRVTPGVVASPDAPRAALVVRVVATSTRAAIVGAAVYVTDGAGDDWRAETDGDGAARFDELAIGASTVHAEATNRVSANRTTTLVPGANKDVQIALDDAVAIEGSVVDADSSAAIPAATVRLMARATSGDPSASSLDDTTADDAGRFRFAAAPAGAIVNVTASAPGHGMGQALTVLPATGGAVARVDLRLDRTGTVRGVVRDPDGRPADGAWVHGGTGFDALTDEGGAFVVQGIPVGLHLTVTAGAPGWADAAPVEAPMLTRNSMDATIDLALRRPATLVVRVLDPSGGVVTNATVWIDGTPQANTLWNSDDVLVRKGLPPCAHRLFVRSKGFPDAERDVTIAEGERAEVAVQLVAGVSIAGVVVDATGAPVAGAAVTVVAPNPAAPGRLVRVGGAAPAGTAADGTFRIGVVAPGRRVLSVSSGFDDATTQEVDAPADGVRIVVPAKARFVLRVGLPTGVVRPKIVYVAPNVGGAPQGIGVDSKGSRGIDLTDWLEHSVVRGDVPAKATDLYVRVEGYVPVRVPIRPEPGKNVDLGEIRLDPGVTLRGRVVDGDGRPAEGAVVSCPTANSAASAPSKNDGSFVVEHVARGPVVLRAVAAGRLGSTRVEAADAAAPVVIVARWIGVLRGVVVDADGAPVNDAAVIVRHGFADASDEGFALRVTTDAHGAFAAPVAAGRCRIVIGESSAESNVPEGGETSVRVVTK